ncbi:hypothetical protein AB4Z50_16270 [Paenibacillus sp. 2TAB26]|uniref:hypothetical protein n=1 Tax=Paenibacillus sp. 2TAB26 TaxID=3233005 RepID=UPI003F98FAF9
MYVKLVNADGVEKAVKLDFKGVNAASTGKWVILTGDASLVHVPNVNKKNDEKITPMEAEIKIENNTAIINLAANSVNVIIVSLI